MLNNLTNFYSIIKDRMLRKSNTVKGTDIIPLGVVNPNYGGGYAPSAITVQDFVDSLPTPPTTTTLQDVLNAGHDLSSSNECNFQGTTAGIVNSGNNVNGFGYSAAYDNHGSYVNAIGSNAGTSNYGSYVNLIGQLAGNGNMGSNVNAIGQSAANGNQGNGLTAIGTSAGEGNKPEADNCIFIGNQTGTLNQGTEVIALGSNVAVNNLGSNIVALGNKAAGENALSNQFIISTDNLPAFSDANAAATAISLANGAAAGSWYLYYNVNADKISAILPS